MEVHRTCDRNALLTGCWDSAEINQLGIATATGIELVDPRDPHGSVRAYVQVASPSQLTAGPTGGSAMGDKKAYVLEDGVGPTASASLTAVQRVMSRRFSSRPARRGDRRTLCKAWDERST